MLDRLVDDVQRVVRGPGGADLVPDLGVAVDHAADQLTLLDGARLHGAGAGKRLDAHRLRQALEVLDRLGTAGTLVGHARHLGPVLEGLVGDGIGAVDAVADLHHLAGVDLRRRLPLNRRRGGRRGSRRRRLLRTQQLLLREPLTQLAILLGEVGLAARGESEQGGQGGRPQKTCELHGEAFPIVDERHICSYGRRTPRLLLPT